MEKSLRAGLERKSRSMDRNAKEKELIRDWAKKVINEGGLNDSDTSSYFVKRGQNEKYILEYDFESVPQLRDLLEEQWEDDKDLEKILTAVLVAAIKNKPKTNDVRNVDSPKQIERDDAEKLPVYIYNF